MPYIDPREVERVKQIDLLSYLICNDPDDLVRRTAREFTTKSHDSLVISNGKWHWFSRGIGGSTALDYLIKVKELSFLEAVKTLMNASSTPIGPLPSVATKTPPSAKTFMPPPRANSYDRARSYLELRGIDPHVISECVRRGLIYESHSKRFVNVVFIGKDCEEKPRYAFVRGCMGNFKGEAEGSDKRYSFKLVSDIQSSTLHIFESAIDAMSFATMLLSNNIDWRHENLLSLGGIQPPNKSSERMRIPQALAQWLEDNPSTKEVILHLDNDVAGIKAADAVATALHGRIECSIVPPPFGKDWNDYLLGKEGFPKVKEMVR